MKKIIAVVVILMVALNILALMPKSSTEADKKECFLMKRPKIELTEVNPGILPNLLKS